VRAPDVLEGSPPAERRARAWIVPEAASPPGPIGSYAPPGVLHRWSGTNGRSLFGERVAGSLNRSPHPGQVTCPDDECRTSGRRVEHRGHGFLLALYGISDHL
jgi:hypothetical protein